MYKKYRVCAVFITYADRAHFLEQAVKATFRSGVDKVIIVDNNAAEKSKVIMRKMAREYGPKLKLVHLEENMGSAGGFGAGLAKARLEKDIDFVWTLDDDCVPKKDALARLLDFWIAQKMEAKEEKLAVFSMRFSLPPYMQKSRRELELPRLEKEILNLNSFCFFSMDYLFSRILKAFKGQGKDHDYEYVRTVVAPYGGLLTPMKLLRKAGLPRKEFFLYFDDTEFTLRMHKRLGASIFLVPGSKIDDLEVTLKNSYVRSYFSFLKILDNIHHASERRLYYEFRNRIALEKSYLVTVPWKYSVNRFLARYVVLPSASLLYKAIYRDDRMKILKKAMRDGQQMTL